MPATAHRVSILNLIAQQLQILSGLSPELQRACAPLIERAAQPPRLVVVGRIKAGKSTLLNALIGAPVAETAALEATNVVTVFHNGAPDRATVHLRSGESIEIKTQRGRVARLPVSASEIAYVERWLPAKAVSTYSLVDTPGLATLTSENEATTRTALIDGFEQTRQASVNADAAIFLFDARPRQDEVDFIRDLGFTPLNTLGLLSRADAYGLGALADTDPIAEASKHAAELERELYGYVGRVLPVSALLAQTAATGVLTESLTREIAEISAQDWSALLEALYSETGGQRERQVIELIGEYGLFRGHEYAARGAVALNQWLDQASGIHQLREVLERDLSRYALLHRAGELLHSLEELVYQHPRYSAEIREAVFTVRRHPAAIPAKLLTTLKSLQAASASREFIEEATRLAGRGPARVGLDRGASPWEVLDRVREKRAEAKTLAFGLLDPAEEAALAVFDQAYEQIEWDAEARL